MARKQKERIQSGADAAALYHIVYKYEGFEESAQALFKLIQRVQRLSPGKKRIVYLDRRGCNPADESPAVFRRRRTRFGYVALPHLGAGNQPSDAWCNRPCQSVSLSNYGGCNLEVYRAWEPEH